MGKLAFLFAGQGAQKPGMGQSLYALDGAPAKVFNTMEIARPGTMADCFTGSAERLAQTAVTQPCIFAVDLAAAKALEANGVSAEGAAGFSLGEIAALAYAGAFSMEEAARLVCLRGGLMQTATEESPGGMAAVLKLGDNVVEDLCKQFKQVYPVNYNCPGQLVVAGAKEEMPAFCDAVKAAGGLARPLAVGGAFHSPFMEKPAEAFAAEVFKSGITQPRIPVYANTSALPYSPPLSEMLSAQMQNPVRWTATILQMQKDGFDTFVEVGPGKTLSGFVKRIFPEATILNVQDAESLESTLAALRS